MRSNVTARREPALSAMFFAVRLPTLLALWWRRYVGRETILRSTPERVLPHAVHSRKDPLSFIVFRLDSMGDVVMTTPLFRELKKSFPDSHLTVVVQDTYRSLLATNPHINEVLSPSKVAATWLPQSATRLLSALRVYIGSNCAGGTSISRSFHAGIMRCFVISACNSLFGIARERFL